MYRIPRVLPDYARYINEHKGFIYIDKFLGMSLLEYDRNKKSSLELLLKEYMMEESGNRYSAIEQNSIINFLIEFMGVSEDMLKNEDKAYSISGKVLTEIANKGKAVEFINLYLEYKRLLTITNNYTSLLEKLEPLPNVRNMDARPLYKLRYKTKNAVTRRVYTEDHNIQAIAHEYLKTISCPDGKAIVSGDFSAIEPTIQYYVLYRDPSLDNGFLRCKDPYGFMFNVTNPSSQLEFTKEFRGKWKQPYLSLVYGSSYMNAGRQIGDTEVTKNAKNWLDNNEIRKAYLKSIHEKYTKREIANVYSFFGNIMPINPANVPENTFTDHCMNYPVQGTAHDFIVHFTLPLIDTFRSQGYEIELLASRHDEPLFLINAKDIPAFEKVYRQFSNIIVSDWRPLHCTMEIGIYYKTPQIILEPEPLTEDEYADIAYTDKSQYFPLRDEVTVELGHYAIASPIGEPVHLMYGMVGQTNQIVCKIFNKSENVKTVANALLGSIARKYSGHDIRIKSNLPLPILIDEAHKHLQGIDLLFSLTSIEKTNFRIYSQMLYLLMQKNTNLSYLADYFAFGANNYNIVLETLQESR